MALGKLAIVTDFSGSTDFATTDTALPVGYAMRAVAPHEYPHGQGQWWAEPDHAAAVEALRLAAHDGNLRQKLGARAQAEMAARLSPAAVGARMAALIGLCESPR
jgi:hypothetical protein